MIAGCGDGAGNGTTAAPVANVAAPAGTNWVETVNVSPEGGYVMGNPNAPIKLVEFGSRTCHVCAAFEEEGVAPLKEKYISTGKLSYEFRDFLRNPIDIAGALIASCNGTAPFFPLTEQMMKGQEEILAKAQTLDQAASQRIAVLPPAQQFTAYAEAVGLIDWAKQRGVAEPKLRQCLADTAKADALVAATTKASEEFEIQGTPTFLINGRKVDGTSWAQIEPQLKAAGG
ncbi:DsbA family protein [Sphingomonas gilva]|uniref:DsbA family protein n=2 Tax=Sphingomonas gilva TaxID=2305907 RepID=A0A396RPX0_9SPHN|nr:DsbA family protein [Sphingomonas gilva]